MLLALLLEFARWPHSQQSRTRLGPAVFLLIRRRRRELEQQLGIGLRQLADVAQFSRHDARARGQCVHLIASVSRFRLTFSITPPNFVNSVFTASSIPLVDPTLDPMRWGRLARIARITRLLRSIRAARVLSTAILSKRRQSTLLIAMLLALVLITASSTAILHFENANESNIKTADNALWWAFATITTVGYGEYYPVTTEGRIVAAILMTAGVGLFGAFSAALAAWFLVPENEATDAELAKMREDIQRLCEVVEKLARGD